MNIRYPLMSLATTLPMIANAGDGATSRRQPNILICVADDCGHMGKGYPWLHTPNFDRVAHEGLLMNNAFTCNAKSAPSRASLITGRNSWQLKEAGNHLPYFPQDIKSFPEALSELGWHVGYTGKGWAPGVAEDANGKQRQLTGKNYSKRKLTPPTTGIVTVDYAANFQEFYSRWDKSQPFCFWYGAREPHRAYEYGSAQRFGKQLSDIDKVPEYWPDTDVVRQDMLDYSVEVEHFDNHLGLMLQYLEDNGELDNTIIIVTSDHNMPFPRCKGQEYYDSNHIPMAMMWVDGLVNPGREINDYISLTDIAPTLLDILDLDAEQLGMFPMSGRSFAHIIGDEASADDWDYVMIGRERHDVGRPDDQGYPIRGLIRGDWLYLLNYEPDRWPAGNPETGYMDVDASPTKSQIIQMRRDPATAHYWQLSFGKRDAQELYNIKDDPYCINNLAASDANAERCQKMKEEMECRLKEQGDPRMEGMGYIFDQYPAATDFRDLYNRIKQGEELRPKFLNLDDVEPAASGVPVKQIIFYK